MGISRRDFLGSTVAGIGTLTLGSLLGCSKDENGPPSPVPSDQPTQPASTPATGVAGAPAMALPPRCKGAGVFGINLHLNRFPKDLQLKQLMQARAAGVCAVRGVGAFWYFVEHKPGARDYGRVDPQLEAIEQVGMEALGAFGNAPAWACPQDPNSTKAPWGASKYPPADLDKWKSFVHDTVKRYRGRIRAWSTLNEPDSRHFFFPEPPAGFQGNAQEFAVLRRRKFLELQQGAYEAAKDADPDCVVLSGAFATGGGATDKDFVQWLIEHGMTAYCDVLDLHGYWSCDYLLELAAKARRWMKLAGGPVRPIWMTEFGAGLREDKTWIGEFTHDQIQSFAPKALATALAAGVERLYWYQGYTDGKDVTPLAKSNYSMNVTDGPTPAAWSFAAAVRLLQDAKYLGEASFEIARGRARGYRFDTPCGQVAVLWAVDPGGLDNRPASAEGVLDWDGLRLPMLLSERPTILQK